MKKLYLAYGSNLNLDEMKERCLGATPIGNTILKDYRLAYKGKKDNFAYLTIEPAKGCYVPLGIFEISITNEAMLNSYEGYPFTYYKTYFPVNVKGEEQMAMIYIMESHFDYHLPSLEYVDACMQGYEHFDFDKKILEEAFKYSLQNKGKVLKKC